MPAAPLGGFEAQTPHERPPPCRAAWIPCHHPFSRPEGAISRMTPSIPQARRALLLHDAIQTQAPVRALREKWTPCFIGRPHLYRALARRPSGARAASERPAAKLGLASTPRGQLSRSAPIPPSNPASYVSTGNPGLSPIKTCRNPHMLPVPTAPLFFQ